MNNILLVIFVAQQFVYSTLYVWVNWCIIDIVDVVETAGSLMYDFVSIFLKDVRYVQNESYIYTETTVMKFKKAILLTKGFLLM